jgi:hypothetical protein
VQALARGDRVPKVHTLGFHPHATKRHGTHRGEGFLRTLAELTGGVYREYDAHARLQVRNDGSVAEFDPSKESFAVRRERVWIEARLTAEHAALARGHHVQPFAKTLAAVRAAWVRERRVPAAAAADVAARRAAAADADAQAAVEQADAAALAAARAAYDAETAGTF